MFRKKISSAILSIFMNKSAKKKFFALRKSRKLQAEAKNRLFARDNKASSVSVAEADCDDIKRQKLIKSALETHKQNASVLDGLSADQKQKLQQLAIKIMFKKNK